MSARELRILAVDDERSQLQDLARLLRASPIVDQVQCAGDGRDALVRASAEPFDAIFLDVRMPDLDGVELSRVLRRFASPPQLVFVTAHEDAAVEAFELHALDYILKPVGRARLEEALQRVSSALAAETSGGAAARPSNAEPDVFAAANVRSGSTRLIQRGSILYLRSYGDFVRIVTADGRYLLRSTLTDLEHRWEQFGFVRVHRQYLANLHQAIELRPAFGGTAELVFPGALTIPVARRHVADLGRRLAA
ncbi:MAG TPA: LytTR family DNA-binding domain-containing protein [Solirubrobacteraceae bacterium]|jgi:DNA-binding LytR/AlgR family response regulator|nr:LytTR family DNA-binding domain-containing protein [Solirubrobacteraceae bacterium]